MGLKAQIYKHTLNFKFDAGTSRGVLKNKDSFFLKIFDSDHPDVFGLGEAGPLKGLSPDFGETARAKLNAIAQKINYQQWDIQNEDFYRFPSVKFAVESAFLDYQNGGKRLIFDNDFYHQQKKITINGLIWMGTKAFMREQIVEKIAAGFQTIKLKIGAIEFEQELELLRFIRTEFKADKLTLRVDANGAFKAKEALEKLKRLSEFDIHSIEQPIAAGQEQEMAGLCQLTPIPIALDEEIILNGHRKKDLLETINPQFIILKPTLAGGFSGSKEWITEAEKTGIGWWITSALESNIGLNAICQFTAEFDNNLPQGLGTGKLFHNNFDSPLQIVGEKIRYNQNEQWNLGLLQN